MNELSNLLQVQKIKRYTDKPWFFQRDDEILYLYKNFLFNERLNDKLNLDYDSNKDKFSDETFCLYPTIPKKLNFYRLIKFRKPIKIYITYQYCLKGNTFVECKILKEVKSDIAHIYGKQQIKICFWTSLILILFFRSRLSFLAISIAWSINFKKDYLGNLLLIANYNEILMKMQINKHYILGRDTNGFINYLNSNLQFEFTDQDVNNNKSIKIRDKIYLDKFFVDDFYDMKFEPEDKLFDYLTNPKSNHDYHQEYLKKLDSEFKLRKI